LPPPNNHFRHL